MKFFILLTINSFSLLCLSSEISNSYKSCLTQKSSSLRKSSCIKSGRLPPISKLKEDMFFCQTTDYYFLTPKLRIDRKSCGFKKSCTRSTSKNCLTPREVLNPKNQMCSYKINYFTNCIHLSEEEQPDRSELVGTIMVDALSDLSACFTNKYPNPHLAKEVEQILNKDLTIKCSPITADSLTDSKLMTGVVASTATKELVLKLFNRFFDDFEGYSRSFPSFSFGREEAAHELLHFTKIQNISTAEHNLGREHVGGRDRIYACSRLCSKSPIEKLTREECNTCLSYPGPLREVNICRGIIPSWEFNKYNELLKDNSCSSQSTKDTCELALTIKKIDFLGELIKKYPDDNINNINLKAAQRNFKRSLLHERTKRACALDTKQDKKYIRQLIKEWQHMKKEDLLAQRSPFDRKPLELPSKSTIAAYCKQIPDF